MSSDAVIVDAVRTPDGKRQGKLKGWHPSSLSAHVLNALVERNSLDPILVDDVLMGCVLQVGEQSLNIGRNGTKLMATLLNELERTQTRYGLQVMCGGMANATLIERIEDV